MAGNAPLFVEDAIELLRKRYGKPIAFGRSRLLQFGEAMACSINYPKQLRGDKYFFGLAKEAVDPKYLYPETKLGDFALLVCGSADKIVVVPRALLLEMTRDVPTRKLDVFTESGTFVLQTTGHPKLNVTQFVNAFPQHKATATAAEAEGIEPVSDRAHVKVQSDPIQLGRGGRLQRLGSAQRQKPVLPRQWFRLHNIRPTTELRFRREHSPHRSQYRCAVAHQKRHPKSV